MDDTTGLCVSSVKEFVLESIDEKYIMRKMSKGGIGHSYKNRSGANAALLMMTSADRN